MHEVGIMQSALALALRFATEKNARRIDRVVLRIGALAGVEPDALRFAFEVVSHGTTAEGAKLEIEWVPAEVFCPKCQREFANEDGGYIFNCPGCGDLCGEIRRGRELELSRIEIT
jgi:hydrogenase nickel incorporation protein HypA/HybF